MDAALPNPTSRSAAPIGLAARLRASLLAKAGLAVGAAGILLALALAAAGTWQETDEEEARQRAQIDQLLAAAESGAQAACLAGDPALAAQVVRGLLAAPAIAAVRIATPAGILAEAGKKDAGIGRAPAIRRDIFSPREPRRVIGEIAVHADGGFAPAQASRHTTRLGAILAAEAALLTLAALLFIRGAVIRPIAALGVELRRFEKRIAAYLPPGEAGDAGELGHIAGLFNRLLDGLARIPELERDIREKAARSEQRFRILADSSSEIVLRYNKALRLTYANTAYAREIKARQHSLAGADAKAALWLPSLEREQYRERLRRVAETGVPDRMLWTWRSAAGNPVSQEMRIIPECDGDGQVVGILVVGSNVTERVEIERQLQHQATHDLLTGLPNRVLFKDRLQHAIAKARHEGSRLVVVFIDLKRFKDVNDTLGLAIGDQLLVVQARRLLAALPDCDTVARIGGDDFVVLLEDSANRHGRETVVQLLRDAVATPCEIDGHRIFPGCSLGVAVYPDNGEDADTLMRNADTALRAAKDEGLNRYRFYAPNMNEELREWTALASDLRSALENREFFIHFQPKLRLADGALDGMEALLRWRHPARGLISPAVFIPIAEKTGLIGVIGQWILNEACRQTRAWLDEGLDPGRVAVNLSAVQCQGPQLPEQVQQALAAHALPAHHLELEITETIMMADKGESVRAFWALRDMGVKISVDDFGTGYSSLSYLKRLPVDKLKIDKSFIDDIETDPNGAEIIRTIIVMAHGLKLETVAEGVETALQYEFLRRVGCDQMQGHYFSRSLPPAEVAALLRGQEATPQALYA